MNTLLQEGLKIVADLMAVSACTAPKTGGADWTQSKVATGEEKDAVVRVMKEIGEAKGRAAESVGRERGDAIRTDWGSDAACVDASPLLFLIGVEGRRTVGINCGGCGYPTCAEMLKSKPLSPDQVVFPGPFCMFRVMDLSIAAGSAVKTAMDHNVDNRMMQKVGAAALKLGLLSPCNIILGIPLAATGKNIFFDRFEKLAAWRTLTAKK